MKYEEMFKRCEFMYEDSDDIAKDKELVEKNIDINFNRVLQKGTIEQGLKGIKIKTFGTDGISINKENIDLRAVEQIVDTEQLNTIGTLMKYIEKNMMNRQLTLRETIKEAYKELENGMLNIDDTKGGSGSLAKVREQEILCAYNRFRKLKVKS